MRNHAVWGIEPLEVLEGSSSEGILRVIEDEGGEIAFSLYYSRADCELIPMTAI